MSTVLRKAEPADLESLAALRAESCGTDRAEAIDWLQKMAGLENVLLLAHTAGDSTAVAAMLAAVPVECGRRRGLWFTGMATAAPLRGRGVMEKLLDACLRAYAQSGCEFAVTVPADGRERQALASLGFRNAFPLRVVRKPIPRNLFASAEFDNLTVRRLLDLRLHFQPACVQLPEPTVAEMVTRLYRRGMTIVSGPRGYGLFCQDGEVLQFLELQADNDHCADRLLQAAREHTGASRADILLAENQTLYLGAGKRCGYGMLRFLQKPFSTTDVYFRLLV